MTGTKRKYRAVVIGTSSGGMNALKVVLPALPAGFDMPVIVVQHIGALSDNYWITLLDGICELVVKEVDEKEKVEKGHVYVAPPNYHIMIEKDETFSLSIDERVNYARPSIDVLFETAAIAYRDALIGIVLTGANDDGAKGMGIIKQHGGMTIAQDPATAEAGYMPASAIDAVQIDHVLPLQDIAALLKEMNKLRGNSQPNSHKDMSI